MMFSIEPEIYTNKDVELRVFDFSGTMKYWVKGGVGFIEFDQDNFEALLHLLKEYDKEVNSLWARLKRKFNG